MAGGWDRGARRPRRRPGRAFRWLLALAILAAVAVAVARLERPPAAAMEVFFVRYDNAGRRGVLVPVRRAAPPGTPDARLEAALRALLAGPSSEERRRGLMSEIPRGTALRGVRIRDGVATVDLTSAFAQGGGSASMLARLWQVVYTATQLREAGAAQITLDGRRVEALGGEGVVIDKPLRRPDTAPAF